jgi:hypothetical protein
VSVRYALHVDGKTLTVYEADELELAREHAQVVVPRTSGPVLLVQIEDDAEPVIVERLSPASDRRPARG